VNAITAGHSLRWSPLRRLDPWPVLATIIAVGASWIFAGRPMLLELAAILLLILPLLVSARSRVLFFAVGSVMVFGPEELTSAKLLFLFGASVALVGAFVQGRALARTPAYADLKPLLRASFALLVIVGLSLPVAHFNGVPETDWLRDVGPYVLLAWSPLFAFDAQRAFSIPALQVVLVLVGLIAGTSFMFRWYEARQIVAGGLAPFALTSLLLVGGLFSQAIAKALDGTRRRLAWLALGSLVLALVGSTGTRTAVVLLAAPLAIAIGTRRRLTQRSVRFALALPIAAVLVALGTHSLFRLVDADPEAVSNRVELLLSPGSRSDQSYQDRRAEVQSAWKLFKNEPLFGVGPGHKIPWSNSRARFDNPFVDTPVGFLPDYGVVGLVAIGFLVASFVLVLRRLRRRAGEVTTSQLALIGFSAVILAYSVILVPFEDKGLAVGLMLLLAMSIRESRERWERAPMRISA
jgi:O-antigen ligase